MGLGGQRLGEVVRHQRRGVPRSASAAHRDDGAALPCRIGLSARALQRFPSAGHVQPAAPGPPRLRRRRRRGVDEPREGDSRAVGLPQRRQRPAPAARSVQPGAADQPQPQAGRPGHRGVHAATRAPGCHRRAPRRAAVRPAACGRLARALRPAGAHRLQRRPGDRGRRPGLGRVGRAVVRHLDAHRQGPGDHPHADGQGRTVAGRRASRGHRAGPVDPPDLRRVGRGRGPYAGRRLRPAPRRARCSHRHPDLPAHQGPHPDGQPRVLPRLPGMGVVPAPLRPLTRARGAAQRGRPDRHQPPRDRRRGVGEAAVGRADSTRTTYPATPPTPTTRWS